MIHSTRGADSASAVASFGVSKTSSTASVDSFAQQLLSAIEGYLSQSGSGSQFAINIQAPQGQNSGNNSQFVVTITNPAENATAGSTQTTAPTSQSATTATTAAPAPSLVATPAPEVVSQAAANSTNVANATTPATTAAATGAAAPLTAAELATMTPDQAYWAEQPAAVQALQYMSPDQRYAAAQSLAGQGYTIDVPIMVWGWDPLSTMLQRQTDGYTSVPSALQTGSAGDAGGSIPVSTAFAIGTNGQDPWIHGFNTTTGTLNS